MSYSSKNTLIFELQKDFYYFKQNEPNIIEPIKYPISISNVRPRIINWLIFLCDNLNFSIQTLYRTVIIFEQYLSKLNNCNLTQEKLNLITIACLSLGTKLEEINCNYVNFFTEKVLNLPNCEIFTVKDLTKMEIEILKDLNFNTLYTTSIDYLSFYLDIIKFFFNPKIQFVQNIQNLAENMMKQNIMTNIYLNMSQSEYAFTCLNQIFIQLGMMDIINQIRNTLMIFNINNLIQKNKSLNDNNSDDNDTNDDINHNLEMNLLSLPDF